MRREMRLLGEAELDGRAIGFEYGFLLSHLDGDADWHVVLLRVPPADMLCVGADPEADCALVALTLEGECLVGGARALPFRSAPDGLRLIGTSPLKREDD